MVLWKRGKKKIPRLFGGACIRVTDRSGRVKRSFEASLRATKDVLYSANKTIDFWKGVRYTTSFRAQRISC